MVSTTFENLNSEKKHTIEAALLSEFSKHPLADAKVSRIVAKANIARGAFYKYFTDLNDAYQFIYNIAITDIHQNFQGDPNIHYSAEDYLKQVTDFIDQATNSKYFQLIKMHIVANEQLLNHLEHEKFGKVLLENHLDASTWANAVLTHETIHSIFLYPDSKEFILKRYQQAITQLNK